MRPVPLLTFLLLILAIAAPAAHAATVTVELETVEPDRSSPETFANVKVVAGPGEANRITITGDSDAVEVRDAGAPPAAGSGCTEGDGGTVRCEIPDRAIPTLAVDAGDGDDEVDAAAVTVAVTVGIFGGPGADRLVGTSSFDTLRGGDGDDRLLGTDGHDGLYGGPGRDTLEGGAGTDRLFPDDGGTDVASDVVDGGPDLDILSYEERTIPLSIDLADPAPDGSPGEADALTGIEEIVGGTGGDRLVGDDGPNTLRGAPIGDQRASADTLDGGGGNDQLSGEAGDDVLRGGDGNDALDGGAGDDAYDGGAGDDGLSGGYEFTDRSRGATRMVCGSGADVVGRPRPRAVIARDCETIVVDFLRIELRAVQPSKRLLRFRVRTPDLERPCGLRITAGRARAQVPLGDRRFRRFAVGFRERPGGTATVTFYGKRCRRDEYRRMRTLRFELK